MQDKLINLCWALLAYSEAIHVKNPDNYAVRKLQNHEICYYWGAVALSKETCKSPKQSPLCGNSIQVPSTWGD